MDSDKNYSKKVTKLPPVSDTFSSKGLSIVLSEQAFVILAKLLSPFLLLWMAQYYRVSMHELIIPIPPVMSEEDYQESKKIDVLEVK